MDRGKPSIGGETANQRLPSDGVGVRRPHGLTPGQGKQKGKAAGEKRDRDQEGTQDRDSQETTYGSPMQTNITLSPTQLEELRIHQHLSPELLDPPAARLLKLASHFTDSDRYPYQ
jgi:hypothetical protein